jgi:hypothetical protein
MLGEDRQAVAEFRQAERLSPAQVHHQPLVRARRKTRRREEEEEGGGGAGHPGPEARR